MSQLGLARACAMGGDTPPAKLRTKTTSPTGKTPILTSRSGAEARGLRPTSKLLLPVNV